MDQNAISSPAGFARRGFVLAAQPQRLAGMAGGSLVVVFAVIHLGIWLGGEFGGLQLHSEGGGDPMHAGASIGRLLLLIWSKRLSF